MVRCVRLLGPARIFELTSSTSACHALVTLRLVEPPNSPHPIAFHQRTARLSLVCSTTRAWLLPILYNTVHLESRRDAASFLLGLGIRVEVVIDDKTSTDLAAGFGEIGLGPGGLGFVTRDQEMGLLTSISGLSWLS